MSQKKPSLSFQICVIPILGMIVSVAGCDFTTQQKQVRTGLIVGGSMFPALVGEHYQVTCSRCGWQFQCDVEQASQRETLVCPNCGFAELPVLGLVPSEAQQPKIELIGEKELQSEIDRWDVIAFHVPVSKDQLGVKRVVGLPGEKIEIRNGNLFANDQILRKPIAVQREMRVAVYDSKFSDVSTQRWTSVDGSRWSLGPAGFDWENAERAVNGRLDDWLIYQHRRCYAIGLSASAVANSPAKIEDSYGFNQSVTRDLNETDDLFLQVDCTYREGAVLVGRFVRGDEELDFEVDTQYGQVIVGETTAIIPSGCLTSDRMKVEFSSFDHQLIILINGRSIVTMKLDDGQPGKVSANPFKLSIAKGAVAIERLQLWRDLYYLDSNGNSTASHVFENADSGYVLLGDNVPISVDSRHWERQRLSPTNVIGRVVAPQSP